MKLTTSQCAAFFGRKLGETMRQIKVKSISQQIEITGDAAKHLIYSLRSRVGERINVVDEDGQRAIIELVNFSKDKVTGQLIKELSPNQRESITLAVSVPKRGFDNIIRQATEIGVLAIQPLITERTVLQPSISKQERWQRIAKEAAEQSGAFEPAVKPIIPLKELIEHTAGQIIFCNETENQRKISEVELSKDALTIIIGCEGGFSESEINFIKATDSVSVTLGSNILKVDTAAIFALSAIKALS